MNYAWAIALITIAVVGIFALDLGGLQDVVSGSRSAVGERFEDVGVTGHRLTCPTMSTCSLDIALQNNGDQRVNVTEVEVLELLDDDISSMTSNPGDCSSDLFPGDTTTCTGLQFDASNVGELNVGDRYTIEIEINYTVLDFNGNKLTTQTPQRELPGNLEAE